MAQEQEAGAKQSLIARLLGSRIAQAVGIFGVAFSLFQGLEPFLEFSRFMAYLVNHWRELTRGMWSWLASFVHLTLPQWTLDLITAWLFLQLFGNRGIRYSLERQDFEKKSFLITILFPVLILIYILKTYLPFIIPDIKKHILGAFVALPLLAVIPLVVVFLTLYPHIDVIWASLASLAYAALYTYAVFVNMEHARIGVNNIRGLLISSERAMFVLGGLVGLNYLALHSHTLEAFIEKATQ